MTRQRRASAGTASAAQSSRRSANTGSDAPAESPPRRRLDAKAAQRTGAGGSQREDGARPEPADGVAPRPAARSAARRNSPVSGWDADAAEAVRVLCTTGMPARSAAGNGARDSVEATLAAGWSGRQVLDAVETWFAYADSDLGRSIRHRGFFTASRIRDRHPLPDLEVLAASPQPMTADERTRAFITEAYERVVRR